jgi:DNA-binding CsgD family transcriptional regulator
MKTNQALIKFGCIEFFEVAGTCYAIEAGLTHEVTPGSVYYLKALELAVSHPDYKKFRQKFKPGNELVYGFIREYMGNFNIMPDVVNGKMVDCDGRTKAAINGRMITPRERDIIRLMGIGKADKEIADTLNISRNTVCTILKLLRDKLHATSKYHIVAMAAKAGIL